MTSAMILQVLITAVVIWNDNQINHPTMFDRVPHECERF